MNIKQVEKLYSGWTADQQLYVSLTNDITLNDYSAWTIEQAENKRIMKIVLERL